MSDVPADLEDRLDRLADDFQALSNRHRLRMLHLLTTPRYGGEIAEGLDMTRQNILQHLDKLEARGFVRSMDGQRASGPVVEYQVVPQRLFALSVSLAEMGRLQPEGGPLQRGVAPTMEDAVAGDLERDHGDQASEAARLVVLNGPEPGAALPLGDQGPRWRIGREEDRDLVLDHDPFVSAHHAEVHVDPQGHAIVDVHSANGTLVNFQRLPAGGRVPLRAGDILQLGHTFLVYQRAPDLADRQVRG